MNTKFGDVFNALAEPFHPGDVKTRSGGQGRSFDYVTPRTVANRLDEVLGWENWETRVFPVSEHAYKCVMTVTVWDDRGRPRRITKSAIGAKSVLSKGGKADPGEDDKGGDSDAFKRVAALFGVGRYLYNDGVMHYPDERDDGLAPTVRRAAMSGNGDGGPSKADKLIGWCEKNGHVQRAVALARSNCKVASLEDLDDEQAMTIYKILSASKAVSEVPQPSSQKAPPREAPPQAQSRGPVNENGNPVDFGWPKSGAALYAWCKNLEKAYNASLVKAVDAEFCKPGGWGREWKEWKPDQVEQAAILVAKRVRELPGYDGQFDTRIPNTDSLKGKIAGAASRLLAHHGTPEPTREDIDRCVVAVADDLAGSGKWPGGESLGDWCECEDAAKLRDVLESLEDDLEDSEIPF